MTYDFPPELARLIQEQMASGAYEREEDLLLDAVQALRDVEIRQQELRDEIQRRLARAGQGLSTPLDPEAIKAAGRRLLYGDG